MRAVTKHFILSAILLFSAKVSFSQTIPETKITTLTGKSISLPEIGSDKLLLLLLSFSHKGSDNMDRWNKQLKHSYIADSRVEFYDLADFQGVPPFIMRMILHGMKRSVQEPERSHTAPFYTDDDKWKKLVGFNEPGVIYIVLADAKGNVIWQTHGPASDVNAAELKTAVEKAKSAYR